MRKLLPFLLVLVVAVVGVAAFLVLSGGGDDTDGGGPRGAEAAQESGEPDDAQKGREHAEQESRRWVPRGPGSVAGVLREYGSDRPLAGVAVSLEAGLPGPNEVLRTTTGSDGTFRIPEAINFDQWTLRAKVPEPLTELVLGGVEVVEDQETDLGIIYVTPSYEIPGIVVDELGEPVAGASVRALRTRPKGSTTDFLRLIRELPQLPPSVDAATTDTRGEFTLTKLPPGRYDFELSGTGHALRIERGVHVSPDTAGRPLRFVLTRGFELSGRVVRPSGGSVEGLRVVAFEQPQGERGMFELDKTFATTDEAGEFHLEGLPAGQLVVAVVPEGRPFAIEDDITVPGTEFVEIVLSGDCFLEGRVTNQDEEPIPEAEVYVVGFDRGNPAVGNAVADADGRYRIDELQSGPVQIFIVQAAGYGSYPDDMFRMLGGRGASDLTLAPGRNERDVTLGRGAIVRGVVLEQRTDEPIAGARVSVLSASTLFGGSKGATTDADGRFEIGGLPKGPAVLLAEKDGYFQPGVNTQSIRMMMMGAMQSRTAQPDSGRGVQISVTEPGEELERELKLAVGSTLKGVVLTPDGTPVAGAEVTLAQPDGRGMMAALSVLMGSSEPRLTAADGTFEMPGPAPGSKVAVVASSQGWLDGRSEPLSAAPGSVVEGLEVRLRQGATVEGTVRNAGGEPVSGALVRWAGVKDGTNPWQVGWDLRRKDAVSTSAEGRFRITGVEPGPVVVQVTHPDYPSASHSGIEAADGKALTADFDLPSGGSVSGVVKLPNGGPAAGARIQVARDGGWQTEADAYARGPDDVRTDSEGHFEVKGLGAGSYSLVATAESYADSPSVEVQPGGAPVTLQLAPAFVISGTVRLTEGSPASGVRVTAQQKSGDRFNDVGSATTNDAGDFVLRDVPAGEYRLRVGSGWFGSQGTSVVSRTIDGVQAGQEGLRIEVSSGLTIAGKVLLPDGSPAGEGWVSCSRIPEPGEVERENVNRNAPLLEGAFELKGLIPGRYNVSVNVGGSGARSLEVAAGTLDVVVRLTEGGKVSGRVTGPDGNALANCNVWASGESGNGSTTTDENGRYTISGLAPGTYRVTAWSQTSGKVMQGDVQNVEVTEGGEQAGIDIAVAERDADGR